MPCEQLPIANGFHHDSTDFLTVINGFAVLIDRSALQRSLPLNGIPSAASGVFHHTVFASWCLITGGVIECCPRSIHISDFKSAVLADISCKLGRRLIISGHELPEKRLIVCIRCIPLFETGCLRLGIHSIPLNTVGCIHNAVRC